MPTKSQSIHCVEETMSSSSDSDDLMPTGPPVTELIKHFERDFDKFKDGLINCENNFKTEIDNLKRDHHSTKKVVTLLDRNDDPVVLERLQYEERLEKKQEECQRLKETVIQLIEEMVDKKRGTLLMENLTDGSSISEMNKKINVLKNKNFKSEQLAGIYRGKWRCLNNKVAKMDNEMRQMKSESSKVVEELKVANKAIEDLRLKKVEADKEVKLFKSKFENSSRRIKMIEGNYAKMSTMMVRGMAAWVNGMGELANFEIGCNDVISPSNGCRNQVQCRAKEGTDDAREIETSLGQESGHSPPQDENNEPNEPLGSGLLSGSKQIHSSSNKSVHPSAAAWTFIDITDSSEERIYDAHKIQTSSVNQSAARDITEIHDNDETNRNKAATSSKRVICSNETDLFQRRKRIRTEGMEGKVVRPVDEGACGSENGSNDIVSTEDSDDESLSDSRMNELVASIRRRNHVTEFMYEADMLGAFQQDEELCMNAVCALYRNGGFSPIDSVSGGDLAKYLIDGNKKLRLTRTVSRVKRQRPDVIIECRRLATTYVTKLFQIYLGGVDPLFCRQQ